MNQVSRTPVPTPLKLGFTAFMMVLVPSYWASYGPTNFLYFCDVALFLTLAAVWTNNRLLVSAAAVGIVLPQIVWVADFLGHLVGVPPLGMTAYMFDPNLKLFYRGLSLFHGWLPFLLVYLVWRLGYDKRGFLLWVVLAELLIIVCYLFMPPPTGAPRIPGETNPPVNINYVYGLSDAGPQQFMNPNLWVALLMVGLPLLVYLPTHALFKKYLPVQQRYER
ncbi:MAG: hypothetical protein AAF384_11675 [Pseudomonadota bacterium]